MKKTMLSAIDKPKLYYKKAKMAKMKKAKMAKMKKAEMAMAKPKFNAKLKSAAAQGKLDNNPKFKAAVMKAKLSKKEKEKKGTHRKFEKGEYMIKMSKKPKMAMKKPKKSTASKLKKEAKAIAAGVAGFGKGSARSIKRGISKAKSEYKRVKGKK